MKAFVITLKNNDYSMTMANRCITSGVKHRVFVERFWGVDCDHAEEVMTSKGLSWGWANNNTEIMTCSKTGLQHFPYTTSDLRAKIGCSMSHFLLWEKCATLNVPFLILEHDAVFINNFPSNIEFHGICQINDPRGATRQGSWWSEQMVARGGNGTFPKTLVPEPNGQNIPDGLAGNSAYLIKPWAAKELINKCHDVGLWPNDALINRQLFPYLEEYYPFITKVIQTKSTTT